MKITLQEIWGSLDRIIFPWEPRQITCQEAGYVIPEALKQAAVCMVRDDRFGEMYFKNPHQRTMDEQNVVDALRELRDNGFINFIDTKETE